jgi:phage-related protein
MHQDSPQIVLSVVFFQTDLGTEPVRDWLKSLEATEKRSIGEQIKTVQIGWPLGMPLVRKLEQGLWEVRISLNHKIARVLFTTVDGYMVLLHGFIKKSQKTPQADLDLAKARRSQLRGQP